MDDFDNIDNTKLVPFDIAKTYNNDGGDGSFQQLIGRIRDEIHEESGVTAVGRARKSHLAELQNALTKYEAYHNRHRDDYSTKTAFDARSGRVYSRWMELSRKAINLRRHAMTLGAQKKTKARLNELTKIADELLEIDKKKTTLNKMILGLPVKIELKFKFEIQERGGRRKNVYISDSRITKNNEVDINRAKKSIIERLLIHLLAYDEATSAGDLMGRMYNTISGKSDLGYTLVLGPNDDLWQSYETSIIPVRHVGDRGVALNAINGPSIVGLKSYSDPMYGCVVGLISEISNTPANVIYERMLAITDVIPEDNLLYSIVDSTRTVLKSQSALPHDLMPEKHKQLKKVSDDESGLETEYQKEMKRISQSEAVGFTVQQLIDYFDTHLSKSHRYTIHFPLSDTIYGPQPNNTNYKSIHMTVMNNHIYLNDSVDNKIRSPIDIELESAIYLLKNDDSYFTELERMVKENVPLLVFVEDQTMDEIAYDIYHLYDIIVAVEPAEYGIARVKCGNVTFVSADEFENRRDLYNKLREIYPKHAAFVNEFRNQSWTTMTKNELDIIVGHIPASVDSMYDRQLIRKYRTHAFTGFLNEQSLDDKNLGHIDISKCFLHVCIGGKNAKIPVFDSTDNFIEINDDMMDEILNKFDSTIGEFIVDKFTYMDFEIDAMVWSAAHVAQLMSLGMITSKHLLYVRCSYYQKYHMMKPISDYAIHVLENHGGYNKNMYTRLFGMFGICETNYYSGFLTTDKNYAAGSEIIGVKSRNINVGLHMLYKKECVQILENHNPVYRYILGGSVLMLLSIATQLKSIDPAIRLLSSRVDSIYYESKNRKDRKIRADIKSLINAEWKAGNIIMPLAKFEDVKKKNIIKRSIEYEAEPLVYDTSRFSNNDITTCAAGGGKSRSMAKRISELPRFTRVLGTCVANRVRSSMKATFAAAEQIYGSVKNIAELQRRHEKGKLFGQPIDVVIVEEFSMIGPGGWNLLNLILNKYPKAVMWIFGDHRQLPEVNRMNRIDVLRSPMVKFMLPNMKLLEYSFEGPLAGRMDKLLYETSEELYNTGRLPESLRSRVFTAIPNGVFEKSIAYTNKTCKRIGALMKNRGLVMKHPWYVCVNDDKRRWFNGEELSQEEVDRRGIPANHLVPNSCLTVHRAQGATYEGRGLILEVDRMSLEGFYTAITRFRNIDNIYIIGDINKLRNHVWKHEPTYGEYLYSMKDRNGRNLNLGCNYQHDDLDDECLCGDDYKNCPYACLKTIERITEINEYERSKEVSTDQSDLFIVYLLEDATLKHLYVGITRADADSDMSAQIAMTERRSEHLEEKVTRGLLTNDSVISEICRVRLLRNSVDLARVETEYIQKHQAYCIHRKHKYSGWRVINVQNKDKNLDEARNKIMDEYALIDGEFVRRQHIDNNVYTIINGELVVVPPVVVEDPLKELNGLCASVGVPKVRLLEKRIYWECQMKNARGEIDMKTTRIEKGNEVDNLQAAIAKVKSKLENWLKTKGVKNADIQNNMIKLGMI